MTHEEVLRKALELGQDPHRAWAAYCLGKNMESVTASERTQAKAENFALLYNASFLDSSVNWPQFPKESTP
jgi:DNA polymerase I-like protein with 3'-5' exonuclease and polymerase domains